MKSLNIGESITLEVASINQNYYKGKDGFRLKKDDIIELVDKKDRKGKFKIHRIIGEDYLILSPYGKSPKLSFTEMLHMLYTTLKRRL
jgi:hypothetical protein